MKDRMSAEDFKALVNSGAIIPTRRGLLSSTKEMDETMSKVKELSAKEAKMQKQMEANKRYLGNKKPARQGVPRKSIYTPGFIDSNLIKKAVKKWDAQGGIFIPYDVASLKNSKQIIPYLNQDGEAKFTLQPSKASLKYKKFASPYWIMAREKFLELIKGSKFPLILGFFFIRKRNAMFDYHNMVQYPLDLMRDFGWIPDDDSLHTIGFPSGHTLDSKCPGVVVIPYPHGTIPFIDHPYKQIGFPDAFMPVPSKETLTTWNALKKWKPVSDTSFYEDEDIESSTEDVEWEVPE